MRKRLIMWTGSAVAAGALIVGAGPAIAGGSAPWAASPPSTTHQQERVVTVTATAGADVRTRPQPHAPVTTHLRSGTKLTVVGQPVTVHGHAWLKTRGGNWIDAKAVAMAANRP